MDNKSYYLTEGYLNIQEKYNRSMKNNDRKLERTKLNKNINMKYCNIELGTTLFSVEEFELHNFLNSKMGLKHKDSINWLKDEVLTLVHKTMNNEYTLYYFEKNTGKLLNKGTSVGTFFKLSYITTSHLNENYICCIKSEQKQVIIKAIRNDYEIVNKTKTSF
eukprot:UN26990